MALQDRNDIDEKYKFDLRPLYRDEDEWKKSLDEVRNMINEVARYKGRLAESAATLLEYLIFDSEFHRKTSQLNLYTSLKSDIDLRNADNVAQNKQVEQLYIDYEQANAFSVAELAAIPDDTLDAYLAQEPDMKQFNIRINEIKRNKPHTLSDLEEKLLAKTSLLGNPAYDTFSIFSDAEMPNPSITLKSGEVVELSSSEFARVRSSSVKEDRDRAFEAYWDNYKKYEGTFGELSNGCVRQHYFDAIVNKFGTCLEAALFANNIPTSVYHSLIENVNKNLGTFHRYLRLKARMLGVETLEYADIYAPCVKDVELNFSYDEARALVLDAIKPLGEDYGNVVRRAFDERWIDAMPSKGKRSGAYSSDGGYDVHPYILMNYAGRYNDVGTLIHELGHTMQSFLSDRKQPYPLSQYKIFVAEVASTFNEALLDHLMLQRLTDRGQRLSLLMNMLDGFKGTLFRQTQFAEFELRMHEIIEGGNPITGKQLSELYLEICRRYYGHQLGACQIADRIAIEWAYIPHFYYNFYVYQYSTSFVASQALVSKVIKGEEGALDRYLDFLSAGCSKYPIDLLRDAGVDMTSPEPFDECIKAMEHLMDEIEEIL